MHKDKNSSNELDLFATLSAETPSAPKKEVVIDDIKATSLSGLDLDSELLKQYKLANRLLHEADGDKSTTPTQKASLMNSIIGILTSITKTQESLYNLERVKLMESILISTLKKFPAMSKEFLDEYQKRLKNAG